MLDPDWWSVRQLLEGTNVLLVFEICMAVVALLLMFWLSPMLSPSKEEAYKKELEQCWLELTRMIGKSNCNPIMLRLAWSDAVTYDAAITLDKWPYCGGVNGSIQFDLELSRDANAGLNKAVTLLNPIKRKFRIISWADLIQMAAVVGIYMAGGPLISLDYGREDAPYEQHYGLDKHRSNSNINSSSNHNSGASSWSTEKASHNSTVKGLPSSSSTGITNGRSASVTTVASNYEKKHHLNTQQLINLCSIQRSPTTLYPAAVPPYPDGAPTPDVHIRNVFYRMGLNNRETVALCGGHTLGRAFRDRSGVCIFSSGDQGATIFTKSSSLAKQVGSSSTEYQFCNRHDTSTSNNSNARGSRREYFPNHTHHPHGFNSNNDHGGTYTASTTSYSTSLNTSDSEVEQRADVEIEIEEQEEEEIVSGLVTSNTSSTTTNNLFEHLNDAASNASSTPHHQQTHQNPRHNNNHYNPQRQHQQEPQQQRGRRATTTASAPNNGSHIGGSSSSSSPGSSDSSSSSGGGGGIGMAGGCSWTRNWLRFDNAYFRRVLESANTQQLLWLPTDQALFDSPEYRPYFVRYARSQADFFADYAAAHKRMSELGARFQFRISIRYDT